MLSGWSSFIDLCYKWYNEAMRIGLFTDSYRPSINGIVYVVESLKRELEALGHEVCVFCPAKSISPAKQAELLHEDDLPISRNFHAPHAASALVPRMGS